MALPCRELQLRPDFVHHTLNLRVQSKHFEEALTCLVESIFFIRSRGKIVSEFSASVREKPKGNKLMKCIDFNFFYNSVKSEGLRCHINNQVCRFRWLSFMLSKSDSGEFYLNFYQRESTTTKYVPYISNIYEVWQIKVSVVRFEEEKRSEEQVAELILKLKESLEYIREQKFTRTRLTNSTTYVDLRKTFDMTFNDVCPRHFFMDTTFPAFAI